MNTEWIYAPMWHIACMECEKVFKLNNDLVSPKLSGSGFFSATCPHCNSNRYYRIETNRVWLANSTAEEFEFLE